MTRYQAESQRAAGAASRLPIAPKPRVTPGGLNALRAGPNPNASTVPTPAAHTSSRELHSARQESATAAILHGSARTPARGADRRARARAAGAFVSRRGATPAGASAAGSSRSRGIAISAVSEFMLWRSSLEVGEREAAGNSPHAR